MANDLVAIQEILNNAIRTHNELIEKNIFKTKPVSFGLADWVTTENTEIWWRNQNLPANEVEDDIQDVDFQE